ncbi:hypothetical protein GCM10027187_72840 [Streptosporangium sandarakinum]
MRGEIGRMVRAAGTLRNLALVLLLYILVLRVSEVCRARADHLTDERGRNLLRVTAKGGRTRAVPLDPAVARVVRRYLDGRTSGPPLRASDGQTLAWRASACSNHAAASAEITVAASICRCRARLRAR